MKQIRSSLALLVITALLIGTPVLASSQTAPASRIAAAPVAAPLGDPVTINLCAETGSLTLVDSTDVPIWGFSDSGVTGDCADDSAIPSLPGPTLTVNQGDVVTVNLYNQLSENVSIAFHGQGLPADTFGVAAGGDNTANPYTFTASQPGTFLYEAGLTPNGAKQVAMGLYGALIVKPASAPPTYTSETVLVLSDIDPALNANPVDFNMLDYAPKYWLINGEAYPDTDLVQAPPGTTLLARYVNAGLTEHSMGLLGLDQMVIAKDGHARPAFRAVSETLAAGQTMDTLITLPATAGARYPLYETGRHLDNNGAANGGMMTFIEVTEVTTVVANTPPTTVDDGGYTVAQGGALDTAIALLPSVLANDTDPDGPSPITAVLVAGPANGLLTFNSDGSFIYAHDGLGTTSDSFTYQAFDGADNSNLATVTLSITPPANVAPTAADDGGYTVVQGGTLDTAVALLPGVLANDTDPDGPSLITAVLVAGPANGLLTLNSDGSFTYAHDGLGTTSDSFTYQAFDGTGNSNTAIVTITITP